MSRGAANEQPGAGDGGWWVGLRVLLREPAWRRWAAASTFGRLSITMAVLALVLAGHELTGSFASGAWVLAGNMLVFGFAAPVRGRRLDRRESRGALQGDLWCTAALLALQALAVVGDAPLYVLGIAAVATAVPYAAIEGGYRALLTTVVKDADLPRANALEAVLAELSFIAGPALAAVVALVLGPAGPLWLMSAFAATSAVLARRLPRRRPALAAPEARSPWRLAEARGVYGVAAVAGVSIGMLESGLPPRLHELGLDPATAGLYLALTYTGSAAGGIAVSGVLESSRDAARRAAMGLGYLSAMLAALPLVASPWFLAVVAVLLGAPIAPLSALATMVLQQGVPVARHAEAFALFFAAVAVGAGVGNALTGSFLDVIGPEHLLLAAAALAAALAAGLATIGTIARRRTAVDPPR